MATQRKEASTTSQPLQIQLKHTDPNFLCSNFKNDTNCVLCNPSFYRSRTSHWWSKAKPCSFRSQLIIHTRHGLLPTNPPIIDWCWLWYIRMVWLGRWMGSMKSCSSSFSSRLVLLPEKNSRTSLLPSPLQLWHASSSFSWIVLSLLI